MADMNAADVLGVDWARRARELLAGARNRERTTEIGLPRPGQPVPQAPTNPLYTALADPKLNRGLANLGEAAADVVLGRPSGLAAVDAGLGSVPGVGAAGILAAGGMPGLLDVAGMGDVKTLLKHGAKFTDKTLKFLLNNYDANALKYLDDYLDRFPKVKSLQVPDAYKILSEGRAGEIILPKNIDTKDISDFINQSVVDLRDVVATTAAKRRDDGLPTGVFDDIVSEADKLINTIENLVEKGDIMHAMAVRDAISNVYNNGTLGNMLETIQAANQGFYNTTTGILYDNLKSRVERGSSLWRAVSNDETELIDKINDFALMQYGKPQDLEKIEAAQLKADARQAEKQARKEAKKAQQAPATAPVQKAVESAAVADAAREEADLAKIEADRARYMRNQERRAEENRARTMEQQRAAEERRQQAVPEQAVPEQAVPEAAPARTWRDGWKSEDHPVDYEGILGKRGLTEDEKRDAFVLDSLASHWANQLRQTSPVKGEWPGSPSWRHRNTNYGMTLGRPGVADQFIQDVKHNVNIGNTPGTSFTLMRKPGATNPMAKAIVVDGYDLYNPVFKNKADKVLHGLEERYKYDPFDIKYMIKENPVR